MIYQIKERTDEGTSVRTEARGFDRTHQSQVPEPLPHKATPVCAGSALQRERRPSGRIATGHCARLASGLAEGLGGSGCLCGALSGGVLALGLFMGKDGRSLFNASGSSFSTALLHREFAERFGSACCKVLSKKVKRDAKGSFRAVCGVDRRCCGNCF